MDIYGILCQCHGQFPRDDYNWYILVHCTANSSLFIMDLTLKIIRHPLNFRLVILSFKSDTSTSLNPIEWHLFKSFPIEFSFATKKSSQKPARLPILSLECQDWVERHPNSRNSHWKSSQSSQVWIGTIWNNHVVSDVVSNLIESSNQIVAGFASFYVIFNRDQRSIRDTKPATWPRFTNQFLNREKRRDQDQT